jgi:hypothetical protein
VLDQVNAVDLRVYAVWVPILRTDIRLAVSRATTRLPDDRVDHFWDARGKLPGTYSRILGLPDSRPAWDVYLLFDRNARWDGEPPAPTQWMHQLGIAPPPQQLDADRLAGEVVNLLNSPSSH